MIAKVTRAATLVAASLLGAAPAFAAAPACATVAVEADAPLRARWPELPAAIHGALDGRDDVDTCARITVRLDHATFLLAVSLPDGRRAARAVSRTEDVVPTLVALVLVPEIAVPALAAAAEPEIPVSGATGAPTLPRAAAPVPRATPSAPPAAREQAVAVGGVPAALSAVAPEPAEGTRLRFEFSLAAGARAGDGRSGVAFAALNSLVLGGWLVGLQGAVAQYGGARQSSSLLLAILGGRRIRFDTPSLPSIDLAVGPALAVRGPGNRVAVTAQVGSPSSQTPPTVDDGPWVRLVAMARLGFRARSLVRPFAGIEGELAPGTSAASTAIEPGLPAWTLGVVAGAAVGTP